MKKFVKSILMIAPILALSSCTMFQIKIDEPPKQPNPDVGENDDNKQPDPNPDVDPDNPSNPGEGEGNVDPNKPDGGNPDGGESKPDKPIVPEVDLNPNVNFVNMTYDESMALINNIKTYINSEAYVNTTKYEITRDEDLYQLIFGVGVSVTHTSYEYVDLANYHVFVRRNLNSALLKDNSEKYVFLDDDSNPSNIIFTNEYTDVTPSKKTYTNTPTSKDTYQTDFNNIVSNVKSFPYGLVNDTRIKNDTLLVLEAISHNAYYNIFTSVDISCSGEGNLLLKATGIDNKENNIESMVEIKDYKIVTNNQIIQDKNRPTHTLLTYNYDVKKEFIKPNLSEFELLTPNTPKP